MLTWSNGDIFGAPQDLAIVVPVNTQGKPGAGLALAATKYKGWKAAYLLWLKTKRYGGSVGVVGAYGKRHWVVAATKEAWKDPSRIEWVCECLRRMAQLTLPLAIPKLGCGRGGLDWDLVRPQVEAYGACARSDWAVYE